MRTLAAYAAFGLYLAAAATHALKEDAEQPIHIVGKEAEIDQHNELLHYRGEVQVDQGTLRVMADRMQVEYHDQKVVRITAHGSPARYQQQLDDDKGTVRAHADVIVYHTQAEKLDLRGGASLDQQGNQLSGEFITYDIVAGRVDANSARSTIETTETPGSGKPPVKMVLQSARPAAQSEEAPAPETETPRE